MATIEQELQALRKWVEIGKNTIAQLIEEGQAEEIIEYEREILRANEEELEKLINKYREN